MLLLTGTVFRGGLGLSPRIHSSPVGRWTLIVKVLLGVPPVDGDSVVNVPTG
jgi:hypothetical protein